MTNYNGRIYFLAGSIVLFFSIITIRLFYLQVIKHSDLNEKANSQQIRMVEINSPRGTIYDRNGKEFAISLNVKSLYVMPSKINLNSEKKLVSTTLSHPLDLKQDVLYGKLNKKINFTWLKRKMDPFDAEKIEGFNLPGVGFINETKRFYPNGEMGCHVIGFAGLDNRGLEGIELMYDKLLLGGNGWMIINKDALGRDIISDVEQISKPKTGASLTLTIDSVIQHIAETELKKTFDKFKAKAGSVIVLEPFTGEVLALANQPKFDLNNYSESSLEERRNRIVTDAYEPGSTFKIVTASAALETNTVKEDDKIYCENGTWKIFDHEIHDHEPRGLITFRDIIKYSNNIGTVKVGMKLGTDVVYKYAKKFGFGELTNVDLPGETKGIMREPKNWSGLSITAVPIGQEISTTPMQVACAFAAIANGGLLMRPGIVKSIVKDEKETYKFKPTIVRRAVEANTSRRMVEILKAVVTEGTGVLAGLNNIEVAGKTGTAQKIDPKTGDYSETKYLASFVGFVPANKPKIVILVILDEPSYVYWGGSIAAPTFKEIARKTLRYMEMQREEKYASR